MSTLAWNKRSSNSKTNRISYTQFLSEMGGGRASRQSRSVERQSRIPLRASNQSGRDKVGPGPSKQRSKSQVPMSSSDTPLSHGKITPSQCYGLKITPGASSNMSNKKMAFLKDTRKLQDKEFLKEATQLVQSYFQEKCPEVLINGVDIHPMTIKMFIAMVNHLFEVLGILDKGTEPVRFSVSTYEKELPYWMKKLEYPGLITKAWLQTVNVPQYWPHVVGLLSWLVKLCAVTLLFNIEEQLSFDADELSKQWAVFYFKKSMEGYRFYNEGKEEEYKELRAELINKFREINGACDDVVNELEAEIAELKEKLEDPDFIAERDAFDEVEQRLIVLQGQQRKLIDDIAKKEDDINEIKSRIAKKQRNCSFISEEIEAEKQAVENLKQTISMQSMSVADIADLEKKTEYLVKEIKYLEKECEDYSELLSRYELEAAGVRDKILQSTHTFNRSIIQLEQLIPDLKEFHIYMDPENEGVVQEREKILNSLEVLKSNYFEKCQQLEKELNECQENVTTKRHYVKELQNAIENQRKQNEMKKKENDELQKMYDEKEKALKEESNKLGEEINSMEEKAKKLDDLKDKNEKLELRYESLTQSLKQMESFWNDVWAKVEEKWKHIPETLEMLLNVVEKQNKELEEFQAHAV